jgi:hypothetical protein
MMVNARLGLGHGEYYSLHNLRQQLGEATTLNKSKNTGKQKKRQEGGQDAEDRSDQADKAWQ